MEKALYDALARVLLQGTTDQYGYNIPSPLAVAMRDYANENLEKIALLVAEKINIDELVEAVTKNILDKLADTYMWRKEAKLPDLEKMVLDKVAGLLAQKQLEELMAVKD
jgi:hypothetical protein